MANWLTWREREAGREKRAHGGCYNGEKIGRGKSERDYR